MIHYVYITTNLVNGNQYVGDHSTNDLDDGYLGSGRPYFKNAIKKYGKENFKKEILEFSHSKKEAFDAQEKYIKKYNTLVPNGYNISPKGGHNCKDSGPWVNKKLSGSHRKNISESLKGKNTWSKGRNLSEDHKKKISDSEKGRIISDSTKEKMSKASKGKPKSRDHANKCGIANLGKKAPRKICEYCGNDIAVNIYTRFHGDKCKLKK